MFNKKIKRTDDLQYLRLDFIDQRFKKPLEVFKKITSIIISDLRESQPGVKLLDVGCGTGEFIYHVKNSHPNIECEGLEYLPELCSKANAILGECVKKASVLQASSVEKEKFDYITFLNTHMIFDDLKPVLRNLLLWTKPGGKIIIAGPFNPDPVDVWVRYKKSKSKENSLQHGWNIISQETVGNLLTEILGEQAFQFHDYRIPIDVPRDPTDCLRQRTLKDEDGNRWLTNGLSQLVQMKILEINKPNTSRSTY